MQSISITIITIFLFLIVSGCQGNNPQPTAASVPAPLAMENVTTKSQEVDTETIVQNNCGGTAEAENMVSRTRAVHHTIDVGAEFTISADGQVQLFGTGVGLGSSIASHFGYSYGVTEDLSRLLIVKAAPASHMEHLISYQEVWKEGAALVTVNDKQISIPFSFRTDFALLLINSRSLPCTTEHANPVPTSVVISPPTPIPGWEGRYYIYAPGQVMNFVMSMGAEGWKRLDPKLRVDLDDHGEYALARKTKIVEINNLKICSSVYTEPYKSGGGSRCPEPSSENDTAIIQGSWIQSGNIITWTLPFDLEPDKSMSARVSFATEADIEFDQTVYLIASGSIIWSDDLSYPNVKTIPSKEQLYVIEQDWFR